MILLLQNISFILLMLILLTGLKLKISSPAIAFILPFTVSSIYLSLNASRWSVDLSGITMIVILVGCFFLILGVLSADKLYKVRFKRRNLPSIRIIAENIEDGISESDIYTDISLLKIFMVIEMLCLCIAFRAILRVSRKYGYVGAVSQLIYGYRFLGTYTTENISLGSIGNLSYNFATAAGFIWVYLLAHKFVNKNKIPVSLIMNAVLSIIMCLLKGGREKAIQLIAAGLLYYLIFNKIKNGDGKEVSPKQFSIITAIGFIILITFQMLGTALGRTVKADFMQYIAVYLSGGIRNLDVYVRNPWGNSDVFGKMTFIRIINYIGGKIHNSNMVYPLDLPYQSANGNNSGNIYTTFYAYLYDFGYLGIVLMPFFIGLFTNLFYKLGEKKLRKNIGKINFYVLIYGYWYYTLLFSFFSNKFYEMTFTITFIRNIVIWIVLVYLLEKIRIIYSPRER